MLLFVCHSKANAQIDASREWTAVNQFVKLDGYNGLPFKLSAYSKVNLTSQDSWAGIWLRVDLKDGGTGFFENMGDNPITKNEWEPYEISGMIDSDGTYLYFGAVVFGSGTFLFDDFKLEILVDKKWKEIQLDNLDFSKKSSTDLMPSWPEGISFLRSWKSSNYVISSSLDTHDGTGLSLSIVE